jgi:hypothetical protein
MNSKMTKLPTGTSFHISLLIYLSPPVNTCTSLGTGIEENIIATDHGRSVADKARVSRSDEHVEMLRYAPSYLGGSKIEDVGRMWRSRNYGSVSGNTVEVSRLEGIGITDDVTIQVLLRCKHEPVADPPGSIEARGVVRFQEVNELRIALACGYADLLGVADLLQGIDGASDVDGKEHEEESEG